MENTGGILYIVSTPIGNLEDISLRALRILKEVGLIAAEDTRHSKKLLNHYEINTKIVSYHQHNERDRTEELIKVLKNGESVALISDAGTPGISDPGHEIVKRCIEEGIDVTGVPGPCAAIDALVISGLDTSKFTFYGFLSKDKKERKRQIEEMGTQRSTVILYESPHRIEKTLALIKEILGDINIAMVKELTKIHEKVWSGNISRAIIYFAEEKPRGEYVLLLEVKDAFEQKEFWAGMTLDMHMDYYLVQGTSKKDAVKLVAKDRGLPKREVYEYFMK
ncbi:16S rRNA (cytidine(1402)-2'-O)-methyltransferase [Alkalibacter mobilis]|uniref:16S rRNA (cytidine(1402)-2'-O)-methyltransferase n=1 Tax=Alkalibacter mobilis TaxID=2787712 RepID=UPI00189EA4D7|nr:16S rRNA (cytidine(1402)-2'-O)-methyltransferase [Alkalibacter mobilis]MBF7096062.1 16S rRNA (cytidine(1402)-2'-O)-methyltransferase [Alkalibacter mobilis]